MAETCARGFGSLEKLAAESMTRETPFYVSPSMVTKVESDDPERAMFVAQLRNVCIVCYMHKKEQHLKIKYIAF